MTTQHTPAPWTAKREGDNWVIEALNGDACIVYGAGWYEDKQPGEANACLIAAAPELLTGAEKLQQAIQAYVRSGFQQAFFRHITDARSELQAAITKARGAT